MKLYFKKLEVLSPLLFEHKNILVFEARDKYPKLCSMAPMGKGPYFQQLLAFCLYR